jgi:hypothetical protein
MVKEHVLSTPHNSSLTPEFATSFCPSYVVAQEASVAPKVSATRQVIQTNGLASSSSLITRAIGARAIMPQSFRPLNMEEEHTLLVRGEEMTRPQVPCVTQKGSKELDLRKWSETWCRSQLPALKGVEGSCWKLRD